MGLERPRVALGHVPRYNRQRRTGELLMARDFEDHCWKDVVSPDVLRIYEPYRRDVYVGERPALLAIDLYNFVYRGDPAKYP